MERSQQFLTPIALAFIFALKILSIFLEVRVHTVKNHRIGHFAMNTELSRLSSLENRVYENRKQINIYCFQTKFSSNLTLEELWRKSLFCVRAPLGQLVFDACRILFKDAVQISQDSDPAGLIKKYKFHLRFSKAELSAGYSFLNNLNNSVSKGFVCLHVRDSAFLSQTTPIGWKSSKDWSYQNHRDSDIEYFKDAANALAEMGYTVFRMGAIVEKPLKSMHPRVIDYATNGMRSEFLDVFLGANCKFAISTGSGWDSIPMIFRRPVGYVNAISILDPGLIYFPCTLYPKILRHSTSNVTLTCAEISQLTEYFYTVRDYSSHNIDLAHMSSEELVEAVTEMAQRVEGTFVETPEQREMQAKLNHILSTHPKLRPSPNYYPIRAQFASCFLSRYPNFLDGLD
jgi:putative glycosyltransferase (TIGR04372 family)